MPRLVHVSDLHFGRERVEVLEPLHARVRELGPDVVVVSGDLTQRALPREFERARSFVSAFERNLLVVPGNHDVPLLNLPLRLGAPLHRWRDAFGTEPEPAIRVGDVLAIGACSAHGFTLKDGRLTGSQRARIGALAAEAPPETWRALVVHHPLVAGEHVERVARGANRMLACLAEAGIDVLFCGHEHRSWSLIASEHAPHAGPGVLVVHAGTSTSTRLRREGNSFNVVDMSGDDVTVTIETYQDARRRFEPVRRTTYRERGRWRLVETGPA